MRKVVVIGGQWDTKLLTLRAQVESRTLFCVKDRLVFANGNKQDCWQAKQSLEIVENFINCSRCPYKVRNIRDPQHIVSLCSTSSKSLSLIKTQLSYLQQNHLNFFCFDPEVPRHTIRHPPHKNINNKRGERHTWKFFFFVNRLNKQIVRDVSTMEAINPFMVCCSCVELSREVSGHEDSAVGSKAGGLRLMRDDSRCDL